MCSQMIFTGFTNVHLTNMQLQDNDKSTTLLGVVCTSMGSGEFIMRNFVVDGASTKFELIDFSVVEFRSGTFSTLTSSSAGLV